jgi:hypothetical protein
MQYTVVPFVANIGKGQGAQAAADQLAQLINQHASQGWRYCRMENVEINIHDPGTKGCFGFGAVAPSQRTTRFDFVVFESAQ